MSCKHNMQPMLYCPGCVANLERLRVLVGELVDAFEALDKSYCEAWAWSAAKPLEAGREVIARARQAIGPVVK